MSGLRPFYCPVELRFCVRPHSDIGVQFRPIFAIWNGEKLFLAAIDQLLDRYVTWRDEYTALIIFNKDNKDFSKVINNAKEVIKEHPNFDSYVKESKNTSISYIFKNKEDSTKKVRLELILFNCI
ncbi:hypothetical protein N5U23_11045 [Aliarcobacter butzleri]|uniref:hypothetical protein n=1 Tax=Aliarcobacter butzleri TaxID=28197 RepID=UPI0021B3D90B|nr:hypothetical protein [Aliarcobacter butzleri]MCT7564534.1 hypothetical protein [Aliarcobacter butzleri]